MGILLAGEVETATDGRGIVGVECNGVEELSRL